VKTSGWDDADTARLYRAFEDRHRRYRRANQALAKQAMLRPGLRVLDLAAGTGGTTAALLPLLGAADRIDCVEPARAMADAGRERLGAEDRVHWHPSLRHLDRDAEFDRIVCGAAIWQWADLAALFRNLARRLAPGGALVFNVPAAYLGEPDGPGGGRDPHLTELLAAALQRHPAAPLAEVPAGASRSPDDIDAALHAAGLFPWRWEHRQRLTQSAWRDWLRLPLLTARLWPGVPADERAGRISQAAAEADPDAWRPERWLGWTAWKPGFEFKTLADAYSLLEQPTPLRRLARRDGALLLRGLLPRQTVALLRRQLAACARAEGLVDAHGGWVGGAAAALHEVPSWVALQQRMGLLSEFQALVQAPALLRVVSTITGITMQGGRGSVCRLAPPEHWVPATPAHRDAEFLRDSNGVWGAWIPLSDCRVADGGLAVAPGSHRGGVAARWAAADLQAGDVLLLSAQTLHRGCPNLQPRRPRLSIDLRFGPAVP